MVKNTIHHVRCHNIDHTDNELPPKCLPSCTEFIEKIKSEFTEREIVILSSTVAQVNYWGRMIKALGAPSAGFSNKCDI